jgi:hypothetical protein
MMKRFALASAAALLAIGAATLSLSGEHAMLRPARRA